MTNPPGEFGARAAALLCSVLAGSEAGQAAHRPVYAQSGRRSPAAWPAHRECAGAAEQAARTPAQA